MVVVFEHTQVMIVYGGPQLSRQKQITHGKSKSLTAKANELKAIFLPSGVNQFRLVFVYFYWQCYRFAEESARRC